MRMKLKRAMAGFLSVLVAVSMLIGGQAPLLVKAEEQENAGGGGSWEKTYDTYLSAGINILSTWIGSSEGTITYEFSNNKDKWDGSKVSLSRTEIEGWLSTLQSSTASEEEKAAAKGHLFGIKPEGQYMRLTAGKDLGGNHLGFEIFKRNEQGSLERQEDVTISYYDYRSDGFVIMSDANRDWEDYMKCMSYPSGNGGEIETTGLIIDLAAITTENYILRCFLPFDSRKNISWWNAKYKGQVAAAGDYVSDDSWVENGTVELVKVVSDDGNDVYYSNEPGWQADPGIDENLVVLLGKAGYDFGDNTLRPGYTGAHGGFSAEEMLEAAEKASGQCNVPLNSWVTVKLTPDAGYQILSASLNEMPLTPDENVPSQFTFQITSNLHFSATFEEASDVVSVDASEVSDAQITGTTKCCRNWKSCINSS